jgi:hypothetical protein
MALIISSNAFAIRVDKSENKSEQSKTYPINYNDSTRLLNQVIKSTEYKKLTNKDYESTIFSKIIQYKPALLTKLNANVSHDCITQKNPKIKISNDDEMLACDMYFSMKEFISTIAPGSGIGPLDNFDRHLGNIIDSQKHINCSELDLFVNDMSKKVDSYVKASKRKLKTIEDIGYEYKPPIVNYYSTKDGYVIDLGSMNCKNKYLIKIDSDNNVSIVKNKDTKHEIEKAFLGYNLIILNKYIDKHLPELNKMMNTPPM